MQSKNINILFVVFLGYFLIILAGFRPLEYFSDTHAYLEMIATYDHLWMAEPTFWIINQFNQLLLGGNDQIFFLIYAILGVTIKIIHFWFPLNPQKILQEILCMLFINNYEIAIAKANIAYSQIQEFSWKNISDKFLNIIRKG